VIHRLSVPAADAGTRLDVWLTSQLEGCTRSLVDRLIRQGFCTIEPGRVKSGWSLAGGEVVTLEVPEIEPMEARPEDLPLTILHEDEHLIAVNKAPGMVVHPAIGHLRGTLVNALLGRYGDRLASGEGWRPGIVHRLDADTSGVMIVARTTAALTFFQDAFKARTAKKRYLALVAGSPRSDVMLAEGWIGRHPKDFRKRAVRPEGEGDAREASTSILVRERRDGYTVVECRPRTGRTHQIRVHCAHLGHPVLADATYGRSPHWPLNLVEGKPAIRRQALHAWTLELPHPAGGLFKIAAPIPADLQPWVRPGLTPQAM
jgi:23S rRNA pseudouridine1911/1915/1917 synthase